MTSKDLNVFGESKIQGKDPVVSFHEVIQNNEHVIVANHNKKGHPNIILNTVIFKNDDVEAGPIELKKDGTTDHYCPHKTLAKCRVCQKPITMNNIETHNKS